MSHEVFISYSSSNVDVADAICETLEENNIQCWIAPRNIRSGKNYSNEILKGIKKAKVIVLVFSEFSQGSEFVKNEIDFAFSQDKEIIAYKIDETMPEEDMEFYLKNKQWLESIPDPKAKLDVLVRDVSELCKIEPYPKVEKNYKNISKVKRDYPSLILLFLPIYWASFIYMGLVSNKRLWTVMGLVYFIPTAMCLILYYQIWGSLFILYPPYMEFGYVFFIFWILAIIHGFLIRNEFLTRKLVLRIMPFDVETFEKLTEEYMKL